MTGVRTLCVPGPETGTKRAVPVNRLVFRKPLVSWRRIGDLNPGWDHSQTALAVRAVKCRNASESAGIR
jgi:hypothetical protein